MGHSDSSNLARTCARCLACLIVLVPAALQAATLEGAWREVRPGDTPAQVLAEAGAGQLTRFDPSHLRAFPRNHLGAWVVLQPEPPWVQQARVLSIHSPIVGPITLYDANGPLATVSVDHAGGNLVGYGCLAFRLPDTWPASQPVLLKFEPTTELPSTVTFRIQSMTAFEQGTALWLSMASASFAVMLAMALMALCFSLMLRDLTFVWYAAYVAGNVMVQAVQTGFLFHPVGLPALPGIGDAFVIIVAATVGFAVLFMLRFCDVARHVPRLSAPLLWLAAAMLVVAVARIPDIAWLHATAEALLNPLLAGCSLLVLAAALICAVRGERMAWYFLAGWTPLLALTALGSAQVEGALPQVDWLNDAAIAAGALESIILSVGLADRALTMRRDRDRAQQLADHDALTGLLNRRAWTEAAEKRLAGNRKLPMILMFLDLDNFKTLNDHYGHTAGDQALLAVTHALRDALRPGDLFGRFGGEEFVVLLERMEPAGATQIAARMCRRVEDLALPVDDCGMRLTVSIGLAAQRPDDDVGAMVERADRAMYVAKAEGRNRVTWEPAGTPG
jgi:diguanylate cyclase (GGDEF)-like protein